MKRPKKLQVLVFTLVFDLVVKAYQNYAIDSIYKLEAQTTPSVYITSHVYK